MTLIAIDPFLLAAARDLCADSAANTEYVRGIAELIIDASVGLTNDEHKDGLIAFLGAPLYPETAPLTADQRRALFAVFTDVFGQSDRLQRHAFTRMVLGKTSDEPVSWASYQDGTLTYDEASKVLDALNLLNV